MNNVLFNPNYDISLSLPNPELIYLSRLYNVDPFITQLLYSKGFDNEQKIFEFFYPSFSKMHNPFLLPDMKKGIIRIIKALKNKEKIMIVGDYDVDGITSTSILLKALLFFKGNPFFIIPTREEGYGLSTSIVKKTYDQNCSLIITVDNGSTSHDAINYAKKLNIDVIVTDHHEVPEIEPVPLAFINPKRTCNIYPFSKLSGAGVAFKLVQSLFTLSKYNFSHFFEDYIELACLGTIADCMDLIDENRIIAYLGLKKMNALPTKPFRSIFKALKIDHVESSTVGFSIAPILNSCGRIENPNIAVDFFTKEDVQSYLIDFLLKTNQLRKKMTSEQSTLAFNKINRLKLYEQPIIVIHDDFHEGIIGIIASRIVNTFKKPSIVISNNGKGSSRSVPNTSFSTINVIRKCGDLLEKYGGHHAASGFSIKLENIEEFTNQVQLISYKEKYNFLSLKYDAQLSLNHFPFHLFEELELFEPFGKGNPKPIFYSQNTLIDKITPFGIYDTHFKFKIANTTALSFMDNNQFTNFSSFYADVLYSPNSFRYKNFIIEEYKKTNQISNFTKAIS